MSKSDGPHPWNPTDRSDQDPLDADPDPGLGPLGDIPKISRRQARLEARLGPNGSRLGSDGLLQWPAKFLGESIQADRFEVQWRAAGLNRSAMVAQFHWSRLRTRVGLGIEPPLAHAVVDRLLGYDRLPAESHFQVTPVEWGIWSYHLAKALDRLDETPGPLGPWDLTIDRVGPERFDMTDLGPIVTWRWRVKVGESSASVRLWIPESLLALWLLDDPPTSTIALPVNRFSDLTSHWIAKAGTIVMPKGLSRLRAGVLLLIEGSPLVGTPNSPEGRFELVQDDPTTRSYFEVLAVPETTAARLVVDSPLRRDLRSDENAAMSSTPKTAGSSYDVEPADAPVTLTVELGRINLPLHRVVELKPGDVLDLDRHPREPVELTSGGRLIARGELVQVDTELGVRVTQVFL